AGGSCCTRSGPIGVPLDFRRNQSRRPRESSARTVAAKVFLGRNVMQASSSAPSANAYERDLDRSEANFRPLTPLHFIKRSAEVFPLKPAVVYGATTT